MKQHTQKKAQWSAGGPRVGTQGLIHSNVIVLLLPAAAALGCKTHKRDSKSALRTAAAVAGQHTRALSWWVVET